MFTFFVLSSYHPNLILFIYLMFKRKFNYYYYQQIYSVIMFSFLYLNNLWYYLQKLIYYFVNLYTTNFIQFKLTRDNLRFIHRKICFNCFLFNLVKKHFLPFILWRTKINFKKFVYFILNLSYSVFM